MSWDFTDDRSTLVQVMAWCRQTTSHYLSQCWPRSLSPYGVTRPQWVKAWMSNCIPHIIVKIRYNSCLITMAAVHKTPNPSLCWYAGVYARSTAVYAHSPLKPFKYSNRSLHALNSHCLPWSAILCTEFWVQLTPYLLRLLKILEGCEASRLDLKSPSLWNMMYIWIVQSIMKACAEFQRYITFKN